MTKRTALLVGILILLGFAGFAVASFRSTLTPYVSFSDARSGGRSVQIAGGLAKGSSSYDTAASALHFEIVDAKSGEHMKVRYLGVKPGNFEDAISIVAIGRFDTASQEFAAAKLLVKCPSKYQGAEIEKTYS